jgi:Carboxypeptidase regulatory-like domain/TonB dependent receptor-like, beta-barrel
MTTRGSCRSESVVHVKRWLSWALAAAVVLTAAGPAHAQAVYGSISGTITDPSGAALPGATVTITGLERHTTDTVVSQASGLYLKERLQPGTYEVKAEVSGFKAAVVSTVRVNVDSQSKVDLRLELGDMTEAVTVTAAEGQLLKTDRADVAVILEQRQLEELPILDRNFTKFILLTPGTQRLGWNHASSENPQGSTQTMVNGQHFSGTGYQLDGTENRDPILGIIVINPTLESIGESKITSQNYDAEFGQATAGVVSVRTKSGTNQIHGSAFEFHQSDKFQARNPFSQPDVENPITGRVLPETKRDQFGASIGGPIKKDKIFFFGDYQGWRYTDGGSKLLTVPTARARTGDLSEYGVNIFDPLTGNPSQRAQFPGNRIPTGRLSPQALAILGLLPLPNTPGTVNGTRDNFISQGSETFNSDAFNVRLDDRVNDNVNAFARYSYARFSKLGPSAFGEGGGPGVVDLGGNTKVKNQSLAVGLDWTLSSTSVLDMRFGWFAYNVDVLPNDFGTNPALDAGIPGMNDPNNPFTSGLPQGLITGGAADMGFGTGLGGGSQRESRCNCPLTQDEKQFQFVTNFTKSLGAHTAKFGIDIRRAHNLRVPSDEHRSGVIDFNAERTQGPSGGGLGLATFLLGDVSGYRRFVSSSTDAREEQWRFFVYAQDTWRANNKWTFNYGLRIEDIMPQTINAAGNAGFFDVATGEMRVVGVGDIGLDGNIENKINLAPRLGVTYQLNEKTVIRMGYGRSYDIGVFGSTFGHSVTQNLPVLARQTLNAPANFERVFTLAQGPPAPVFPSPDSSGRFPAPDGVNPSVLPEQQRLPYVDAYNLTVQRELSPDLSAEIAYVGNKGTHVFHGDGPDTNFNQPTIVGFPNVPRDLRRPFFRGPVGGFGGDFGLTTDMRYLCNCGDNNYNSLQTKLTKRFTGGYSVLATYTLQSIKNHGPDQVFFDRDLEYGSPEWARTHNFTLATNVELPFGRGKRFFSDASTAMDYIVGGWQLNANVYVASGLHLNVDYRDAGQDRDAGPNRPNVIGDITAGGGTKERWFNATPIGSPGSAFSRPAVGTFGDMERGSLIGPGFWNVDASLFKRFRFTDRTNLELRLEAQNVFNHVALGNPDTNLGVPGNDNQNAGRINGTAPNWQARNLQFGLRLSF